MLLKTMNDAAKHSIRQVVEMHFFAQKMSRFLRVNVTAVREKPSKYGVS